LVSRRSDQGQKGTHALKENFAQRFPTASEHGRVEAIGLPPFLDGFGISLGIGGEG
jgi:hypothetical protein